MTIHIVQERFDRYACRSRVEEDHALREISQEIVLAALGRTDFFHHAGFHGGTCLRIFYGLNRFSEDMDFALRAPDPGFSLMPHLEAVRREVAAYGYHLEVDDRSRMNRAMRTAFLKDQTLGGLLRLSYRPATGPMRKLRIKVEVDTCPPPGASYEMPVLDFPFASAVRTFDLPSLFAGKIHALLCRAYTKGRDWYDFIWYTARGISVNHRLLDASLDQTGPWQGQGLSTDTNWCMQQIAARIEAVDMDQVRQDAMPFMKAEEQRSLALWSKEFFLQQCWKMGNPQRGIRDL